MRSIWLVFFITSALLATIVSCESEFDPYDGRNSEISAYGYLEVNADTQWVRVVPGRKQLERSSNYANLGINLVIKGEEEISFRDTLLTARDGQPALLFYTTDVIDPFTTWDLSITGPGYNEVTAKIEVPDLLIYGDVIFDKPYYSSNGYSQSFFINSHMDYFFVEACYVLAHKAGDTPITACMRLTEDRHVTVRWDGILVEFMHTVDRSKILEENGLTPSIPYYLYATSFNVIVTSDDWIPSEGVWDREFAIKPGVFSNTSNGLGFIGGVAISEFKWYPTEDDSSIVRIMGFSY